MLYNLDHAEDIDRCVRVSSIIRILPDMRVRVFSGGERLPDEGLQWAFSHICGTLRFGSQLDKVISRYFNSTLELDSATRCNMLAESIERISPETDDNQQTVMFLAEQLRLLNAKPKGRRYSTDTLIRAFTWYHKSTACHLTIQRLFCLPSLRLLRDVASHLNTG